MAQGFAQHSPTRKKTLVQPQLPLTEIHQIQASLPTYFDELPDPRASRTKKHLLKDILVIALLAVIAGAQGWEDMENYGLSKQEWLTEFLQLPHGIPSDDTFRRLFERINPIALENCLSQWLNNLLTGVTKEVIPIDGKSIRSSYDRNQGVKALHLVTAWASQQRLILGQVKVEDHSNEITAIPALLELIDISGAIITIDAMGTQTEIVKRIRQKKADYVLCLKANHPTLFNQVKQWFKTARENGFCGVELNHYRKVEKGHHRIEKRQVWAIPVSAFGGLYQQQQWYGLKTIVVVERIRHLWNKTTKEVQFYLSSLPTDAQLNGNAIRKHWGIENQVHWTLDVSFGEDDCRIRAGKSPHNFALLRRWGLNILNQEKTLKRSTRQKSKRAAMNNDYMIAVLKSFCLG
jgi:predicted transposase YbfD/YdcC